MVGHRGVPHHDVYYAGTERLKPDEMRVIACGTGMPIPRLKQAAACFLVELGIGENFIFDMGEGSFERINTLGIPLDQLDKMFLGHLHLDHAGDFPAFYATGPVNNRLVPLTVYGPSGVKPEWGTKAWTQNMKEMWAWELASRGGAVDPRGLELNVVEFDWKAVNNVIYDENGLKFTTEEAVFVGTQGHTTAAAFGKIMSMTKPRMAVCYHFQSGFEVGPAIRDAVRQTYDGPLDLAMDFMVWNVTKDEIGTRMAVPNLEMNLPPPQRAERIADDVRIKDVPVLFATLNKRMKGAFIVCNSRRKPSDL